MADRFGRRGQRQYGVDILDFGGSEPLRGAQCKHHGKETVLDPDELRNEVEKAKSFPQALGTFSFLTTARRSTGTQLALLAINRQHKAQGLFQVELLTWEAIERLLDDYPDLQERLMTVPLPTVRREVKLVEQTVLVRIDELQDTVVAASSNAAIDREIAEAKAELDRNEFELAQFLFQRLRANHWDRMTARQRFRVLANTGATLLAQSRFTEAARCFLDAGTAQPEHEKAKPLEALAYELLGQDAKAYDLAGAACAAAPTSCTAAAVRIRTAPEERSINDLLADVAAAAMDAEVHVSLAIRALRDSQPAVARSHAERATALQPDWPAGWLTLGNAIVSEEGQRFHQVGRDGHRLVRRERVERAEVHLSTAIELANRIKNRTILVEALVLRAQARELLNKPLAAALDIEEGFRVAPDSPEILSRRAALLDERGDLAGAIATLRTAVANGAARHTRFMLGKLLLRKGDVSSRGEAIEGFRQLAEDTEAPYQEDAAIAVIRDLLQNGATTAAESLLAAITPRLAPAFVPVLQAMLATAQGRQAHAAGLIDSLSHGVQEVSSAHTVRAVARYLVELGRYSDALPLLQRLHIPGFYTEDTHHFIACAERVGRFDLVLEACAALRRAGTAPLNVFHLETSVLERFDPDRAVVLLQERLVAKPDDRLSRLRLSAIGLRRDRPDLVSSDPSVIPTIEELDPQWLRLVVAVLQAGQRYQEAVEYAYQGLRRYFRDHKAHLAFLDAMKLASQLNLSVDMGGIVQADSAVCFVEHGPENESWLIIERGSDFDPARNETSVDESNAKPFLGKRVGDVVELTTGAIQNRTAKIQAVLHKYAFRYQDILQRWQLRFPDLPYIQMVRLTDHSDETSEQFDFAPLLRAIDAQHIRAERVFELYRQQPCPIHTVATILGEDDIATLMKLAGNAQTPIRSRYGEREVADAEMAAGMEALRAGLRPILDPTALATIILLGLDSELGCLSPRVGVTPATLDALNAWRATFDNPQMLGTIGRQDGHYVHDTMEPEHRERLQRELHEKVALLKRTLEALPVLELTRIDKEVRSELEETFGVACVESMAKGAAPGSLLWTDDGTVAFIGKEKFGAKSVWTELVLRHWSEIGQIERSAYELACAKLLAWRFSPIPVNAEIILAAGEAAKWNPDAFPLKGVLVKFGAQGLDARAIVPILLQTLPRIFRAVALSATRTVILVALLARLSERSDGLWIIRILSRHLERAFGLDVGGYIEATSSLSGWLACRSKNS